MGSLMLGLERANHIMTTYFSIFSKFIFQIVFYDVVRKISDKYFLRVGIFAWSSGKRPRVGIVSSVWSIGKRARVVARSIGKRPRVGKISSVWSIGKRARVVAWSSDKRPTSFLKRKIDNQFKKGFESTGQDFSAQQKFGKKDKWKFRRVLN